MRLVELYLYANFQENQSSRFFPYQNPEYDCWNDTFYRILHSREINIPLPFRIDFLISLSFLSFSYCATHQFNFKPFLYLRSPGQRTNLISNLSFTYDHLSNPQM